MKEMVGGCCVCSDERGWPENPLVYCDGGNCNVAVHQACYGIVTVPTGPWYCRKCESQERSARVRCELCPSRTGALKKTNTAGWAHVVCALYIPEVRFGNVTTMEPINLDSIPMERYGKACYICQELNKGSKATMGACMQCNKTGCRQQFHVTCAQQLGLLCEEAGNYLDNVKYCGYCQHHYSKLKKGGNVKLIPPYKPITYETGSSDGPSSPEKESETTVGGGHGLPHHLSGGGSLNDGPTSSGSSMIPTGPPSGGSASGLSKSGGASVSGSQLAINASASSNSHSGGGSASASSTSGSSASATKNRKSSSASKSSAPSSSSSSSNPSGAPSGGQHGSGASGQPSSSSSGLGSSGSGGQNTNGSSSKSSTSSSSSKDYKDKHGKGTSSKGAPTSKDRDSYKDKSSKSSSSSSSSSSTGSSKNKEGGSSHHGSHGDGQVKSSDHSRSEKSSSGGGGSGGGGGSKGTSSSSILAPSVLQHATATAKDAPGHKFPYSENNVEMGGPQPDAAAAGATTTGGTFVNDSKLSGASATATGASSAAPVVSTKKRKASDSSKLHAVPGNDEKIPMKDVSVTLIPLRTTQTEAAGGVGESKKVKSERGSPLQQGNADSNHFSTSVASSNSPVGSTAGGGGSVGQQPVNLHATQTGATSISITKQPSTTTNVIIKPPIIKDIGSHLSSSSTTASSVNSSGSVGPNGSSSTTSLVVSVPLSPVNVPGAGSLGSSGSSSSSLASQNLFQQAIQNRSEHLNFSNTTGRSSSQPSSQAAALSRASPIIAGADQHHGLHHRQSPLIQSSSLGLDNGGRSSLSPSMGGNVVHQSDSGMLKVTYEKHSPHGNVSRLAALQDDAMSSSRRSRTPDFNSFSGGNSSSSGGLKISYEPQTTTLSVTTSNTTLLTPSPSPSMSQMSGTTPTASNTIGAQPMLKDSPPSSPNSEAGSSARKRARKQQEAASGGGSQAKVFQNGIHASHMLGNQLNPNSSVAQKMSDQLHMELEAHSVYTSETNVNLVGPMFPGKQRETSAGTSKPPQSAPGPPSLSSMLSGGSLVGGGAPQSLEQLLERQWEQGSQFLMEQAQHFDIASLLSCLHQLRAENVRLEDHVNNLVARRDHLLAVNARLAIPLNQATGTSGSYNSNGPMEAPSTNAMQRGSGPEPSSVNNCRPGAGGAGVVSGRGGHGVYTMENGIDFRAAAQQQQQSMMIAGHQGGGGPGSGSNSSFVGTMHR